MIVKVILFLLIIIIGEFDVTHQHDKHIKENKIIKP